MLFCNIDIIDENFEHKTDYYVGVINKKIEYISKQKPKDADKYGEVYNGKGKVMLPGFVNAHSHSAMTLLRGYAENLALSDWLNTMIFPFEAHLDNEAIYDGTMLAAAEMLRFGITSTTDMYFGAEPNCRAAIESGIKINLGVPVTCFDDRGIKELPVYSEWMSAIPEYHGYDDGRLLMDIAVHAEYTSTPKIVRESAALAAKLDLRLHTHLSETKSEHEECKLRHGGMTPAQYFNSLGAFDIPTTAAHCVWLEGEDYDIFKAHGVTVAGCPLSNMKLASGFGDAVKILNSGINFALGTDGVASNNNINMFEEIKLFATLFKATNSDPTAITPTQAIFAATRAGALSQGRENTGLIKEGYRADITVLDTIGRPHLHPCHNMLNNLVFSAVGSEVVLTMVDGRVLYKDGIYTSIDVERCIYNAEQSFNRVKGRGLK